MTLQASLPLGAISEILLLPVSGQRRRRSDTWLNTLRVLAGQLAVWKAHAAVPVRGKIMLGNHGADRRTRWQACMIGKKKRGESALTIDFHERDLPGGFDPGKVIAVDTETMGLNLRRDRLCLVQMSKGDGNAVMVQIRNGQTEAPNLARILSDQSVLKIFHYARADIAILMHGLGIEVSPVYCTKLASRLVRTNATQHGLKALVYEFLNIELEKQQQSSDWAADELCSEQLEYAASDVLHLHELREQLNSRLARDGRREIFENCCAFLPTRAKLDVLGWKNDVFAH